MLAAKLAGRPALPVHVRLLEIMAEDGTADAAAAC